MSNSLLRLVEGDFAEATPHEVNEPRALPAPREEAPNPFERKSVYELFDMALSGEIPRERELKQGEPERLSAQHLQWVLLRSMGFRPGQIVQHEAESGREVTLNRVSVILHHPDSRFILSRLMSYRAETTMGSVAERLAAHAHEMIDINLHHARNVKKPELSQKTSMELLKMHYAAEQREPPKEKPAQPSPDEVSRLASALEAANRLKERGYSRLEIPASGTGAVGEGSQESLGPGSPPSQAPTVSGPSIRGEE